MKRGEKITIQRLESGLYLIDVGEIQLVGGAASAAVALVHHVFGNEAQGDHESGLVSGWPKAAING
jgi:hypothetical protein